MVIKVIAAVEEIRNCAITSLQLDELVVLDDGDLVSAFVL